MNNKLITMTFASIGLATVVNAATWTVGPGPGYDFPLIQDAIAAAATGDDIDVAGGTYFENLNLLGKDLVISATTGPGSVIVDGGAVAPAISCISGETSATLLRDLWIQNGRSPFGGGLLVDNSSPTVTNCAFVGNNATRSGAGIALLNSKSVIQSTRFENNVAFATGGHIHIDGGSPKVLDCMMFDGHAGLTMLVGHGGGINAQNTSALVARCTISDCHSSLSGGGVSVKRAKFNMEQSTIENCTSNDGAGFFSADSFVHLLGINVGDNYANNSGGGIFNYGSGDVLIENCHIKDNDAVNSGGGMLVRKKLGRHDVLMSEFGRNMCGQYGAGACYFDFEVARIDNSHLFENIAMNGGGVFTSTKRRLDVSHTNFVQNEAQMDGGGLYARSGIATIIKSAFIENRAGVNGGGMKMDDSRGYAIDSEFTGNEAIDRGGALYNTNQSRFGSGRCSFSENQAAEGGALLNDLNSRLVVKGCKVSSNQAYMMATSGGGLTTDSTSASFVGSSVFCSNSAVNILGPYTDLGGNTIAAICP